jgi:hypothetical protein
VSTNGTESRIVSVSRRTDVPAFYGEWFMRRLAEGHAAWENPFGWRYDPVLLTNLTETAYHLDRFASLAKALEGAVRRCVVSFVCMYAKVRRNLAAVESEHGVRFREPDAGEKRNLALRLAEIAAKHGMSLHICCGNAAVGGPAQVAHCVDGEAISRLYFGGLWHGDLRPTREECGCTASTDIGCYDSCPHGCVYCYANVNKARAAAVFRQHDPLADRLGAAAPRSPTGPDASRPGR